jgi:uncharacterized membrane protein YkvA (DUF1232 family)
VFRLVLLVGLGIVLYFGLRRLAPDGSVSAKQWLTAVAAVILVLLYVRSPIDLIPDGTPVGFLDDLLVATGAYVWLRRYLGLEQPPPRQQQRAKAERRASDAGWDPYAVLGVGRGASHAEIAQAYRTQMKRYHPDRVDDMGEELRNVAHEKTLEIQRAYEELGGRPRPASS